MSEKNAPPPFLFKRWMNKTPKMIALGGAVFTVLVIVGVWYYASPKNTQIGYTPKQPIPYSHKLHVDGLGMDCRYCHTGVETGKNALIPPSQTCMNCHATIKADSPKLAPLRKSVQDKTPIPWIRVNKIPDHAHFPHQAHVTKGVGCVSCHGRVDQMEEVRVVSPLSMSWCLECHQNPSGHIRDKNKVTEMTDAPGTLSTTLLKTPLKTDCSRCHR